MSYAAVVGYLGSNSRGLCCKMKASEKEVARSRLIFVGAHSFVVNQQRETLWISLPDRWATSWHSVGSNPCTPSLNGSWHVLTRLKVTRTFVLHQALSIDFDPFSFDPQGLCTWCSSTLATSTGVAGAISLMCLHGAGWIRSGVGGIGA